MKRKEFFNLWAIPIDIQKRKNRIEQLQDIVNETGIVSDTVMSSTDNGNATTIGHATVTGIANCRKELEAIQALKASIQRLNERLMIDYAEATKVVETIENPAIRAAASMRCFDGKEWTEIALEMGNGSADYWRITVTNWAEQYFDK